MPTPRGTKTAIDGSTSMWKVAPKLSPSRMSTQAPKIRPVASEMNLSHGSVWMPRVAPREALKEMLFCTGPKSGSPRATIFSRCQFSLNHPRASPCSGIRTTSRPGIGRGLDAQAGHHWPFWAYVASVASLWGRHQSSCSWYHAMVLARPDSKSWNCGCQPSSWRSLPDSMA